MEQPLRHIRHDFSNFVIIWVVGVDDSGRTFGGRADADNIRSSLASAALLCGVAPDNLHTVRQVHGTTIVRIDEHQDRTTPREADGLITMSPGQALAVTVADCAPIVLANRAAMCLIHSGWRGTAAGIAERGVKELRTQDADSPIKAWIGPLACGQCYEVGDDVAALFPEAITPSDGGRWTFDNRKELVRRLGALDVTVEFHDERCTISDTSLHSHRRDGARAGRNLVIARMHAARSDVDNEMRTSAR